MAAPIGNQYYKLAKNAGRPRIFESPDAFLKACNEYFEWCLENPIYEVDFRGKDATRVEIPRMRPFTIEGCCHFMNISLQTFYNYAERDEFLEVSSRIRQAIEVQQFEGAAAGFLNASIIARKLGLADKRENKVDLSSERPILSIDPFSTDKGDQ